MKLLYSLLCALALSPLAASAADQYPEISQADLKKAIAEKKVVLLDANGSESYKARHIPGALDFETANLKSQLAKR